MEAAVIRVNGMNYIGVEHILTSWDLQKLNRPNGSITLLDI